MRSNIQRKIGNSVAPSGYFIRVLVYFIYLAIGAYVFLCLERQNEIELCQAAKNISTLYMKGNLNCIQIIKLLQNEEIVAFSKGTELWIWKQFGKEKPETFNWNVTLSAAQYQLLIDAITTVSRDTGSNFKCLYPQVLLILYMNHGMSVYQNDRC